MLRRFNHQHQRLDGACPPVAPCSPLYKRKLTDSISSWKAFPKRLPFGFINFTTRNTPGTCPINSRSVAWGTQGSTFYKSLEIQGSSLSLRHCLSVQAWNRRLHHETKFSWGMPCFLLGPRHRSCLCSPEKAQSCSGHSQPELNKYPNHVWLTLSNYVPG